MADSSVNTVVLSANTSWYLYNFRVSTIRALVNARYRVVCLSPRDDYSERLNAEPGCEWLALPMDNQGSNPFRDAALFLRFLRYYRQLSPAVVCHFTIKNNIYGTWAARLLGIPAINNVSGLGTSFTQRGFVPWIARLLYRSSQCYATWIFCQNRHDLQELCSWQVLPEGQLELIPGSGVDTRRFTVKTEIAGNREFRFLYAGRMLVDKGLLELQNAMETLIDKGFRCQLWLCGFSDVDNSSSITEAQIQAWAEKPYVQWLGPTDHIETIYADVDCFVLPSYREGIARTLLEAGATGLPAITTDAPGCCDVISDGFNGFICKARSVESLTDAMIRMLALDPEERRAMGRRAREHIVDNYEEQRVIDATLSAIKAAVAGKLATPAGS